VGRDPTETRAITIVVRFPEGIDRLMHRRHSAIVKGSGHWPIDEAPAQVIPELTAFLDQPSVCPAR